MRLHGWGGAGSGGVGSVGRDVGGGRVGQRDGDAGGANEGVGVVDGDMHDVGAGSGFGGHVEGEDVALAEQVDEVIESLQQVLG